MIRLFKLEGGGKPRGKRRSPAPQHRAVPPGAPLFQEVAIRKHCAVAGQQQNDGSPQHRMKEGGDRAAAPEVAHVLPAELGANAAAAAPRQSGAALPQQEQQESDASDAMLPAQNLHRLLTEYRARIVTLEDAAVRNAALSERQSQKHAAAEELWDHKTQDLQMQLKRQTERADALQSALQNAEAKDRQLAQQTVRANGLQAALEEAQAAAAASRASAMPQAASASHAELSDMEIMLRAIGIVPKVPIPQA